MCNKTINEEMIKAVLGMLLEEGLIDSVNQINNYTMEEPRLILSRIQTPDGTILTSYHRHDYVTYTDANGEEYILDGGNDYQRTSVNKESFKDLSIWSDAPYEIIRENFHRGGRGKNSDEPLKWVPLSEMSDEWIKNCI